MERRRLLLAGIAGLAAPAIAQARRPRVAFINPGEAADRGAGPYWPLVARAMTRGADSLGLDLEVLYGERDHLLMLKQAEELSRRPQAPDFVVLVNEKLVAPTIMRMFAGSPSKLLLIHNDLTPEQRREFGNERESFGNWIGTITTEAGRGAWLAMEWLYQRMGTREPRIIAITGDPQTPVSRERADAVYDYVQKAGRGRVLQLVYGDWTYRDGEQKASVLLARYPDANVIWANNDSMALGALRAVKARGASVLVVGGGGWPDALESIARGELAACDAGNFMVGAWVAVLAHDYAHGHDFAADGPVSLTFDRIVVHRQNVQRYDRVIMKGLDSLDLKRYSKVLYPRPGPYRFSLADLVDGTGAR